MDGEASRLPDDLQIAYEAGVEQGRSQLGADNAALLAGNAAVRAENGQLHRCLSELEMLADSLRVRAEMNSSNSSLPPSSDRPGDSEKIKQARKAEGNSPEAGKPGEQPKPVGKRKRGAQVDDVGECAPVCVFPRCDQLGTPAGTPVGRLCAACGRPLSGPSFGPEPGYRLEAFLGSGYFADVFRALDLESGIAYAAKVYGGDPPKRQAWARETAALRRLVHRRLPTLKESFEEGERLFVVMELVKGASLRQEVTTHGPLAADRAVKLGIEACEVLEYVASQGWTYRDLHPRNIHLNTPKGAMLLDLDGARPPGWPAQPAGRVGYRAPELEAERPVSSACDVYSLVGCLYFALMGDDPPSEPGPLPKLHGQLVRFPLLADLLNEGRRADPAQRPTAGALRAALERLVSPDG